jgi:hypothetical protein
MFVGLYGPFLDGLNEEDYDKVFISNLEFAKV